MTSDLIIYNNPCIYVYRCSLWKQTFMYEKQNKETHERTFS